MKLSYKQQKALETLPFDALNAMQEAFVNAAKKENELILLSPTGTGKTFAFLFPLLDKLDEKKSGIQAMIIVPSRELAVQIEHVFKSMKTGFKINAIYGGHSVKTEINNFSEPPAVLVGTPGRIDDHLNRKNFDASRIEVLILDEFDKSLELGFQEDMKLILNRLPKLTTKYLTSATPINNVPRFVRMVNPKTIDFTKNQLVEGLSLFEIRAEENDKLQALFQLICTLENELTLVFCNHREAVERIALLLNKNKIENSVFHGGLEQGERERALVKFRNGSSTILVTTDLASRGLDIPEIKNVIHYQVPVKEESFIHRNGRTARMQEKGVAYLILSELERVPDYINSEVTLKTLPEEVILPKESQWKTVYISGGKKDKINKIDLVGFFLKQGRLKKEELGKIEVFDKFSYVAIDNNKVKQVLSLISEEKIKKKRYKIEIAN